MTAPDDPFAKRDPEQPPAGGSFPPPGGDSPPPSPYGTPPPPPGQYGTPPPAYGAPGGYGSPPAGYGAAPSGFGPGSGRPELASWGTRALGYLVIYLVVEGVLAIFSSSLSRLAGLVIFLVFGYLTGTTGQTPGRRAAGIRVLRESDGQFLGAGAGIGRSFLHIVDFLPILLGFFWPIWDAKKQTFADKIIGSVVVKV